MFCHAIINREEGVGLPKTLGKKKLLECSLRMKQKDKYEFVCLAGHIRKTEEWDNKSFSMFYETRIVKVR